jgi:hypothetical protein
LISASFAYTTHRSPLEAYADAYQVLRHSDGPRGKVMLDVGAP